MEINNDDIKSVLLNNLPQEILPGPSFNKNESVGYITDLLKKNLPSADTRDFPNQLKGQRYLLGKHRFQKVKKRKRKKAFLTRDQRRKLNLLKLPKNGWNYENLKTLREIWKEYMRENLSSFSKAPKCSDKEWDMFSTICARSELVGADMKVIMSKICNQVGMSGTVVLETKMTFQIVTPQSELKTIVKENAVFEFKLDNMRFVLFGKYISSRPSERSVKKIKARLVPDL